MNLFKKIIAGMVTATFALTLFVGTASAASFDFSIHHNGRGSINTIVFRGRRGRRARRPRIRQSNKARVNTVVVIGTNTGNCDANGNTGGSVDVDCGGDTTIDVDIRHNLNTNILE